MLKSTPGSLESKGVRRKSDAIDLGTCVTCKKPWNENKHFEEYDSERVQREDRIA